MFFYNQNSILTIGRDNDRTLLSLLLKKTKNVLFSAVNAINANLILLIFIEFFSLIVIFMSKIHLGHETAFITSEILKFSLLNVRE